MDRWKMLEWVQALCFVVVDMELYLDTHPCDTEALAYYKEAVENYKTAKKQFEENKENLLTHRVGLNYHPILSVIYGKKS